MHRVRELIFPPVAFTLLMPIVASVAISSYLGIFYFNFQGNYGESLLFEAKETLTIIFISVIATWIFAILAISLRNFLKFFLLIYFGISAISLVLIFLFFIFCTGLCPSGLFFTPIFVILIQLPNFLLIYLLQQKPKLHLLILTSLYSLLLVVTPLLLYIYSTKTLPQKSEENFSADVKNLGINLFEPAYLPIGFAHARSDLNDTQFSSLYCHNIRVSNAFPCFRLEQSKISAKFSQYKNTGDQIKINRHEAYIYNSPIGTDIVWQQEGTTIFIRFDPEASKLVNSDEMIKVSESLKNKM